MLPVNRWRFMIVVTLQIGVQLTGNTSLAYFAPQVFTAVGAGDSALLVSGFFGVVKVISCLFFLLFLVERIGRKGALFGGALLMGAYMLIIAVLTATNPPGDSGTITATGAASIAMIFLEAMSYNMSWGPVSWLYMSEIFPSRVREAGVAVGTATQWLFNFVFSQVTPYAIKNIGWKTFLMFCIFNWALVVYTFFVIKETKGRSLEEMEARKCTAADPRHLQPGSPRLTWMLPLFSVWRHLDSYRRRRRAQGSPRDARDRSAETIRCFCNTSRVRSRLHSNLERADICRTGLRLATRVRRMDGSRKCFAHFVLARFLHRF